MLHAVPTSISCDNEVLLLELLLADEEDDTEASRNSKSGMVLEGVFLF